MLNRCSSIQTKMTTISIASNYLSNCTFEYLDAASFRSSISHHFVLNMIKFTQCDREISKFVTGFSLWCHSNPETSFCSLNTLPIKWNYCNAAINYSFHIINFTDKL